MNSQNKGKRAEREVVKLLQPLVDKAYHAAGKNSPLLLRTGYQASFVGGSDISGVPFLAIEVKHHRILKLPAWWRQTIGQANGALPILFYRTNNVEFRCRFIWQAERNLRVPLLYPAVDTTLSQGKLWVYLKLCEHLDIEPDTKWVLQMSRLEN